MKRWNNLSKSKSIFSLSTQLKNSSLELHSKKSAFPRISITYGVSFERLLWFKVLSFSHNNSSLISQRVHISRSLLIRARLHVTDFGRSWVPKKIEFLNLDVWTGSVSSFKQISNVFSRLLCRDLRVSVAVRIGLVSYWKLGVSSHLFRVTFVSKNSLH